MKIYLCTYFLQIFALVFAHVTCGQPTPFFAFNDFNVATHSNHHVQEQGRGGREFRFPIRGPQEALAQRVRPVTVRNKPPFIVLKNSLPTNQVDDMPFVMPLFFSDLVRHCARKNHHDHGRTKPKRNSNAMRLCDFIPKLPVHPGAGQGHGEHIHG